MGAVANFQRNIARSAQAISEAEAGAYQVGAQGLLGQLRELNNLVAQVSGLADAAKSNAEEALNLTLMLRT